MRLYEGHHKTSAHEPGSGCIGRLLRVGSFWRESGLAVKGVWNGKKKQRLNSQMPQLKTHRERWKPKNSKKNKNFHEEKERKEGSGLGWTG